MPRNELVCRVCNKNNSIITGPEFSMICTNCGAEFSEEEWIDTNYDARDRSAHAEHDEGLGSIMGPVKTDISGQFLDTSVRSMKRLDKYDRIIKSSSLKEKSLRSAIDKFDRIKGRPEISDAIIENAKVIYKDAQIQRIPRRTTIDATVAASIYLAFRKDGIPWTLEEIADYFSISCNLVEKSYRMITLAMGVQNPAIDPVKCIEKIAVRLEINPKIKRYANDYMNNLKISEITIGKNAMALAGAILYKSCIHCNEPRTQAEIADASDVAKETLRKMIKSID